MRRRWIVLLPTLLLLVPSGSGLATADAVDGPSRPARAVPPISSVESRFIARIYVDDEASIRRLQTYDLLEFHDHEAGYLLAIVDDDEFARIADSGFRVETDLKRSEELQAARNLEGYRGAGIPGFPCYRTVEEVEALAQSLATARPDLVSVVDVGDSWEKLNGFGGYDLRVLKLTNQAISGPKPKLFATCSIHAREYTPAELCTRFAESLVADYGVDADTTWILDHHEIHLMLHANPDGRKQAETGLSWRKNTNQDFCGTASTNRGVDLNRNFEFRWGCCGGSSTSECDLTYRGESPASEPETQVVQNYARSLFPDQRADDLLAAAPDDATGVYLDIHSFSELVLWPWGWGGTGAPNEVPLRAFGRKLAFFNGYNPQQAIDLYITDGTTIDFAYGDLGVASYVFELGTSFFQDCATFENQVLPDNLPALLYAAKSARAPYMTAGAPDIAWVESTIALLDPGASLEVRALADDTRYSSDAGVEPSQAIAAVEISVGRPFWDPAASPLPMTAVDGAFDSATEQAEVWLDGTEFQPGKNIIFVRARDSGSDWGVPTALFVYVRDGSEGAVAGSVTAEADGSPLFAQVRVSELGASVNSSPLDGSYRIDLPPGSWTIEVQVEGYLPESQQLTVATGTTVGFDAVLREIPRVILVDDDDNGPDVRQTYTEALDAMDIDYLVWDTGNSDDEPTESVLAAAEAVIWFSGDEFGGSAGPGSAGEQALSAWLDQVGCLFLASQDYYYDRGLTNFMQDYLGLGSATSDSNQSQVTGNGSLFSGVGPYSLLTFPYSNYTDTMTAASGAEVAFDGNLGPIAVNRVNQRWVGVFSSFGLEGLGNTAARQEVLQRFFDACDEVALEDADADGTPNGADCAPTDPSSSLAPSPALGLQVGADTVSWQAPLEGDGVLFDLLSSDASDGWSGATCLSGGQTATTAGDTRVPQPGGLYYYLVRSHNGCGESLGSDSNLTPRSAPDCP